MNCSIRFLRRSGLREGNRINSGAIASKQSRNFSKENNFCSYMARTSSMSRLYKNKARYITLTHPTAMAIALLNPVAISARFTVFTRISAIKNIDTNATLAAFHLRCCCNISRNRLISFIGVLFVMWLSLYKTLSSLLLQLFVLY